MSILTEQIQKALERDAGVDVRKIASSSRDAPPDEIATARQKAERLRFLRDSLGDAGEARRVYERIIHGNEIQPVNYLAKGVRVAEAVARIAIRDGAGRLRGWGTGFLVAPGVLITNHHVVPDSTTAATSQAHFRYETDLYDQPMAPQVFALEPQRLFFADEALDFAVVAVAPRSDNADSTLDAFGFLPLIGVTGKVADGEWLTVVQHPNGERKQLCVRENKLLKRTDDVLWYSTDTLGGSSGSPVFNNDWHVVALHHSGIPETRDGQMLTHDGQPFDPARHAESDIKWIANEGIRVSRIVDTLRGALPAHPLLQPMLRADPDYTRLQLDAAAPRPFSSAEPPESAMSTPSSRYVTVTLAVDPRGSVSIARQCTGADESTFALREASRAPGTPVSERELPFDDAYADRKGYRADFLGREERLVPLPRLSPALQAAAARLIVQKGAGKDDCVLKYHNFSVVMHAERRFAIYTAANLDAAHRYHMTRPADVWRFDPRIAEKAQVGNFYYRNNRFDRGHLTRREDLEYGATRKAALLSAADTCHWTNCTPQHERFNKNPALWHGLERYILEQTAGEDDELRVQVFTGPLLEEDDPVHDAFPTIQYPVRFWKVVVAKRSDGQLSATAYLLDQSDVIAEHGIEAAPQAPYGAYGTFQVKISEIERLTDLQFGYGKAGLLRNLDPLESPRRRGSRSRVRMQESAVAGGQPAGYHALDGLPSIILDA